MNDSNEKKAESHQRSLPYVPIKTKVQPTGIYFIQGRPSSIGSDNHLEKEKEKKNRNAMHDDFCVYF